MAVKNSPVLQNVQSYGQLLPVDILLRILNRDREIPGLADSDYHLVGERLNEVINRSWQKMLSCWRRFENERQKLGPSEAGTGLTRDYFLLPLFKELDYGRLSLAKNEEKQITSADGKIENFAISHFRDESPIHLVGCNVSLDKRSSGVSGAARQTPHSLVQEFLNRSDAHLWGFVANGLLLRILRDNASLNRQAYLEFNLQGIFAEESFSDFVLLWLLCHHSRVHTDNSPPEQCWLERWSREAKNASVKALDSLRYNVHDALVLFAQGFMNDNPELARKLVNGELQIQDFFRQLLRLLYRLIFLFVVEERGLLHARTETPDTDSQENADSCQQAEAREIYYNYWSLSRLRDLAGQIPGNRHHDLWEGLKLVMHFLAREQGCRQLGLRPMGGFLWSDQAMPDLSGLRLSNLNLLTALRSLAFTDKTWQRRPVDWRHLGAMELGSIYESLLEQQPALENGQFSLKSAPGNERKTTGSYYTPTELIDSLLTTALEPVLAQAAKSDRPELAILDLKICDPACGSGHFLLAAARRVAKRLAQLRTGDSEPSVTATRHCLREVVARCIYGMDINPMSVELCKLGLWLETHEPGKPLSFLDHHLICANSLMGTSAAAIREGLPQGTHVCLGQDDRKAVAALNRIERELNKKQARQQISLFAERAQKLIDAVQALPQDWQPAASLADMQQREQNWRDWQKSKAWQQKKFLYDMWTAAFVLPAFFPVIKERPDGEKEYSQQPFGLTWKELEKYVNGEQLDPKLLAAVHKAAEDYKFFHYEVMFPEVAAKGGFDLILGNPPWERIKLQEKEWFTAMGCGEIASAPNAAARRKLIAALADNDPAIFSAWQNDLRKAEAFSHFLRDSGIYPFCGRGDINLYTVFAEWMRDSLNENGRLGCIVPSGIASDSTTQFFFRELLTTGSLVSLYDFENKGLFPDIDDRLKFCLLTAGSGQKQIAKSAKFIFFAHSTDELKKPERLINLSSADISLLNPNTQTCPIFKSSRDAELCKAAYRRVPVLINLNEAGAVLANPWGIKFNSMFHMTNDSHLFHTYRQLESEGWELQGNTFVKEKEVMLPLYEAKMLHHFNHRWATFTEGGGTGGPEIRDVLPEELENPDFLVLPRYWVDKKLVQEELEKFAWQHEWLIGIRGITNTTNERSIVGGIMPLCATGNSLALWVSYSPLCAYLPAILSSFACDFFARFKIGGINFNFYLAQQLAVLPPAILEQATPWQRELTLAQWLKPRILELTYTANDLTPFARELGYEGKPFVWNEERRAILRAELDAAFFHLYLPANLDGTWQKCENESQAEYDSLVAAFATPRLAVEHAMESFPITREKDIKQYGSYRTKEMILANYDAMQQAIATGQPWQKPEIRKNS